MRPRGRLQLTIRSGDGTLVAERDASNRVLQRGAQLLAALFTGKRAGGGINRAAFGFGTDPLQLDGIGLRPRVTLPDIPGFSLPDLLGFPSLEIGPEVPLTPADFTVETGQDAVTVNVKVSLTPSANVDAVSEAALFADQELYNHVLFEPVDLKTGQVITFFWEITFPFGN